MNNKIEMFKVLINRYCFPENRPINETHTNRQINFVVYSISFRKDARDYISTSFALIPNFRVEFIVY